MTEQEHKRTDNRETPMTPSTSPTSWLFRLVVPATAVFILTVMALIASVFGDPDAPAAQWLDQNGNELLMWEFIVVMALAVLAMAGDRRRLLQSQRFDRTNTEPQNSSPDVCHDDARDE